MRRGVSLCGGFSGSETVRDARDGATNVTVLNGGHQNCHVVYGDQIADSTIDRLEGRKGEFVRRVGKGMT
jgi:hypothetical protein